MSCLFTALNSYYFPVTLKWKFEVSNMDYQFPRKLSYLMSYLMFPCPLLLQGVLLEYTNFILT